MALKFQFWPVLFLNLFLLLLLQTTPSSAKHWSRLEREDQFVWAEDEHFGIWGPLLPSDPGLSDLSESLNKAGYKFMPWFVENKLIPAVRHAYGYNGTITIFVPQDLASFKRSLFDSLPDTKILRQVVPLNLDRHTFGTNFSMDSTFPTFSQDFTNPSFELSDHIRITEPLIDNSEGTGGGPKASINNVPIIDWELYNDGSVIVHGVPRLFQDPMDLQHSIERRKKDFEKGDKEIWFGLHIPKPYQVYSEYKISSSS